MSGKRFIIMYQFEHFTMGTCYYPEHWPEGMWPEDLARMKAAGICVVRIAEFAWTLMEPQEGLYDFSLFAHFLELCARYDMKVILCTPTATPPAFSVATTPCRHTSASSTG